MRANYKLHRIHVPGTIASGDDIALAPEHAHHLRAVLRMEAGGRFLVFNGRDGEWLAEISRVDKKGVAARLVEQVRPQDPPATLHVLFAPLKIGRLDYLVQKLVEMGAGVIQPVLTDFTQNRSLRQDKLEAWVQEAAQQCGILAIPELRPALSLDEALAGWEPERSLMFCDEDSRIQNPLEALAGVERGKIGVLIGPEGGFSDRERAMLRAKPFVTAIPLGPRILRADTAAVAALAVVQAALGDWR
jgi:16S rRNA (uracil1498-N3)-methyltransferase